MKPILTEPGYALTLTDPNGKPFTVEAGQALRSLTNMRSFAQRSTSQAQEDYWWGVAATLERALELIAFASTGVPAAGVPAAGVPAAGVPATSGTPALRPRFERATPERRPARAGLPAHAEADTVGP